MPVTYICRKCGTKIYVWRAADRYSVPTLDELRAQALIARCPACGKPLETPGEKDIEIG